MFSMSLKSVPGCLVLIAPMLIGARVAATPGLLPQAEAATAPPPPEEELAAEEAALLAAGALEDAAALPLGLELELELHAASKPSDRAATAAAAVRVRQCTDLFMCSAFWWLTASH